ncbi:helix-turn-helix transcriptional regulator [Catenulispora sp. NL8]|uniref:Helix-turn-helix transcriptional regulator n=2 Tax=Catenulispora pinistramenti TaxID=2705254 RepID=A0ABS5L461_9ACTN|nr:helix-turn-helix transcriptional regulator [Catenulispora pinistramenti]MBS2553136.1 helix-turn-helix transcriptional regulator [Catenulispora pinistramenti]
MDDQRVGRDVGVDLAAVARLLADGTRAAFCLALLDGRAWTAGELARYAGVTQSTATSHLNLLVGGGLLADERHGRHRYLRIADRRVFELLEVLAELAPRQPVRPRSLTVATRQQALLDARLCYDHLAGAVALEIKDAMVERGLLVWDTGQPAAAALTDRGAAWFADVGIVLPASRRPPVRACLDWTERRTHLAGVVGGALCGHALAADWVTRVGTTRALRVTPLGRQALHDHLGLPIVSSATRGR